MLDAVQAVNTAATAAGQTMGATPTSFQAGTGSPATPFSQLMTDATESVQQLEDQAHQTMQGLMSGSGVDVHQAVIAQEKASMAFELALSVRNKAVAAYQQVIGMQF
ncbi:flagellar hook-basal body complex protein FliE [Telmatobacter bradus]|uniref:flagellar hook-basal body complex protein FliE n=1 Tax=Telmatobacter bradus TaxID=474953 RepID=UPI003B43ADBE